MTWKKGAKIVLAVAALWLLIFFADYITVRGAGRAPVFCIADEKASHYTGLGYSYDAGFNSFSGQYEYCLYLFGHAVRSTFTNGIPQ